MTERASDFEWRGEGDEAEIVVYASDERAASSAFERALPAARLPGVESPVYAAASPEDSGSVAVSRSHAAPDLLSVPVRGILLVSDVSVPNLGLSFEDLNRLLRQNLSEVRLPPLPRAGAGRICEGGARRAAEDGLIDEEDLSLLEPRAGDPDALGRRALSAGTRAWDLPAGIRTYAVGEIHDSESADSLGLEPGLLAVVVLSGAGDLGRLAVAAHRERILDRVRGGDFGAGEDLPAAPVETEEAADLLAAAHAAANFADGRSALAVYALRRALGELTGNLDLRAAWRIGGVEEAAGLLVHRLGLAEVGEGDVLVSGGDVGAGKGTMHKSAPPFGAPEDGGRPWEEAGLLERWSRLDSLEGEG